MSYNFIDIEKKWQKYWAENKTFEVTEDSTKPKYYVLDMFPYPSGAGLHVGHPLGYIASDIITRYKRLCGFNVLHPMGYDSFGLPAEQYAIKTGKHPAVATEENVKRYKEQLDNLGLSFDWSRMVKTSDPSYYKHTQWIFLKLFESWYDREAEKAKPISDLISNFEKNGNANLKAASHCEVQFSSDDWNSFDEVKKEDILQAYRLAYRAETTVNWCPELGTVLANDEVKEGFSVRGSHPVFQKKMMQWCLRVTAYAKRLLEGLDKIDWSDSLKEMQKNWIGRSEGAEIDFKIDESDESIKVFTTRADTIFGATFMVLAPESDYVNKVTTVEQANEVQEYLAATKKRSERERIADVKKVSGVFSGSYCINPFNNKKIPIWIADYVLGGYGTGAIMAVPAHDSRDYSFAKHFDLPIIPIIKDADVSEHSMDAKSGELVNSDFLNGLDVKDAISKAIEEVEKTNLGKKQINFKLRDAIFSRQRYWGEPFPIYFENGISKPVSIEDLPLELPEVDKYLPTKDGEPPLARAASWEYKGFPLEFSTMPGFAGSSAYFLRYMDPKNENELVSKKANSYWKDVDLYVGGVEHATGHLLYSRFWNMFLYDLGFIVEEEPFKKLVNQGMIQGRSNFVYRVKGTNKFVSLGLKDKYDVMDVHVDVNIVKNDILDLEAFKNWMPEYKDAEFELEDGQYKCGYSLEKMSKSKFNVVNPDKICEEYGADTLRLYEMFLGPIEQSKPWNTNGIEGVFRFLAKYWKLIKQENLEVGEASADELKILHTLIKKVDSDLNSFSLNTSVSAFMICVNDLSKIKCKNKSILKDLTLVMSPFTPHICEEVWQILGEESSIAFQQFPKYNEEFLVESNYSYPISINGKMKFLLDLSLDLNKADIEKAVLENEKVKSLIDGKELKKIIVVPKKIVNLVV